MYEEGKGVTPDYEEALYYYEIAADDLEDAEEAAQKLRKKMKR
jgi:TPR repeat protein